jgi:hypothetical protein
VQLLVVAVSLDDPWTAPHPANCLFDQDAPPQKSSIVPDIFGGTGLAAWFTTRD